MYNTISLEYSESLAVIKFIRPEILNPLDIEAGKEINRALDDIQNHDGLRALVIMGSGKAFSAGGDVKGMLDSVEQGDPGKYMDDLTDTLYNIGIKLRKLPLPVVAAVNGYAVGAGMNLALCCDFIVASEKASFAQSFSKLALIPGFGGTHLLANSLPWQKACEIAMLGEPQSAEEMRRLGFVNTVVAHDLLETEALSLARKLAKGPTLTFSRTKELFLKSMGTSFESYMPLEREMQVESARSEDYAEGVRAMNHRKSPDFKGE